MLSSRKGQGQRNLAKTFRSGIFRPGMPGGPLLCGYEFYYSEKFMFAMLLYIFFWIRICSSHIYYTNELKSIIKLTNQLFPILIEWDNENGAPTSWDSTYAYAYMNMQVHMHKHSHGDRHRYRHRHNHRHIDIHAYIYIHTYTELHLNSLFVQVLQNYLKLV